MQLTHVFKAIVICVMSFMFANVVKAAIANEIYSDHHFFVGLSAGPTWVSGNSKQTLRLQPDIVKTYTANNNDHVTTSAELFMGWQKSFVIMSAPLLSQVGVSFVGADYALLNGDIWEDSDPTFNNYFYHYKVNHAHIAAKARLVGNYCNFIEPYISASIGIGFNHAYNFTINPKIPEEVPAPPFHSNTLTSFIYTVSIGIQKSFASHFQIALGYEFADWGKSQLARATGQTINQGLSLNHLYAHQLQLSFFYVD